MAPIGDTVRFIHYEQADALGDRQQHLLHELIVGEPLWRDQ
jgi:hypothetical protein